MSQKPKTYWANWMLMCNSLSEAKDENPKPEWEDLREYVEISALESAQKEIEMLQGKLVKYIHEDNRIAESYKAQAEKLVEALKYYGDVSLGNGAWVFRKKFMFDLINEFDLEQLEQPIGENEKKYVVGGKLARKALAEYKKFLKEMV